MSMRDLWPARGEPAPPGHYLFAASCVVLATSIKLLSNPFLGSDSPFFLYFAAVMATAWYAGFRLGIATTFICALLAQLLFVPPQGTFLKQDWASYLRLVVFLLEGGLICYWTALLHQSRRSGEQISNEFRLLVDGTLKHSLILLDSTGRIKSWNHGARKVLGYTSAEIIDQHLSMFFPADASQHAPLQLIATASELGRKEVEGWCVRKDGSQFRGVMALTALRTTRGQVSGFVLATYDVTDRWRAESALQESERQLRLMADSLPVLIAYVDVDGRYLFTNATYERWLGISREDCFGKHVRDVLGEGGFELLASRIPNLLGGEPQSYETVLSHQKEGIRNVQVDCVPHRSSEGKILGFYMLIADITPLKAIETALRAGEERLRSIVSTAVDAIITLDRRGTIESVNSSAEQMFGHSSAEMVGQNIGLFLPVPDLLTLGRSGGESARSTMRRMIKSGREIHALRKDGSTFPVEITVSDVGSLGLFTGILRDVSQRMELEREVLEATAAEQRRIGQELHDHVGQELTGLELLVDSLIESVRTTRGNPEELGAKVASGLRKTHREVRALARGLLPVEIHPSGLREALEQLAARIGEQGALACRFRASGTVQVSDAAIATHMYRIAQEAIANSIRHGNATLIDICLRVEGGVLHLEIEDDGIGIEDSPVRGAGLGLRLMEYRASLISGVLNVEPGEAKGTKVSCRIPQASYAPKKVKPNRP